jgi:hypothetical protein
MRLGLRSVLRSGLCFPVASYPMASLAEDVVHLTLAGQADTTENASYDRVEATGDEDLQVEGEYR